MKDFVSTKDISRVELEELFAIAKDIKKNGCEFKEALKGFIVATLFYEPSTRTRLSFESAVLRLGGSLISTENAKENASAKKGESLEDTIKIIEGYADMIILRHNENDSSLRASKVSKVPIINAGAGGGEHPTQALLDVFTMQEKKNIDGIKIAIMGDLKYGRTVHSLLNLLSLYKNIVVYGFAVKSLELPKNYKDMLISKGITYIECREFEEIPNNVDFIYQTRVQEERLEEKEKHLSKFILNKDNFSRFSDSTYILHPLPRVDEISTDLDGDKRALYFTQAHNGVYIRQALMYKIKKDFYENNI